MPTSKTVYSLPQSPEATTSDDAKMISPERAYFDEQFATITEREIEIEFAEIVRSELADVHAIGEGIHVVRGKEAEFILATSRSRGPMDRVVSLFRDII